MSCRGRERYSFIPRWNEEVATLEAFEQRVRDTRVVLDFSPEGDTFRHVRDILTDLQLEAADGSGAQMIVKTIRLSVGPFNPGRCSLALGLLHTRFSATKRWNQEALDTIHTVIYESWPGIEHLKYRYQQRPSA